MASIADSVAAQAASPSAIAETMPTRLKLPLRAASPRAGREGAVEEPRGIISLCSRVVVFKRI
jgi:hypothetical protein